MRFPLSSLLALAVGSAAGDLSCGPSVCLPDPRQHHRQYPIRGTVGRSGEVGRSAGARRAARTPADEVGEHSGRHAEHHRVLRCKDERRIVHLPLEALKPYLLDVPHPGHLPPDSPLLVPVPALDWQQIFGNRHPVELEIGFGKGMFLVSSAEARPEANFLGVEIERKYALLTANRAARRRLANVKLACTDARWFLRERVAEASIMALHVYFPDPWWKNRHRKRKLMTSDFAEECARVLRPGGRLHFITDVADYFAATLEMLNEVPVLIACEPADAPEAQTNFERKYRLEGRTIRRACYEKTA